MVHFRGGGEGAFHGVDAGIPDVLPSAGADVFPERVKEVISPKGKLRIHDYARYRVRYFVDGAVFGTREFVEEIFQTYRGRFGPKKDSPSTLKDPSRRPFWWGS